MKQYNTGDKAVEVGDKWVDHEGQLMDQELSPYSMWKYGPTP